MNTIIAGEGKNLRFTFANSLDVSSATFTAEIYSELGDAAVVTIVNGSFDVTNAATGVVLAPLTAAQTLTTLGKGTFIVKLTTDFGGGIVDIDISDLLIKEV